MYFNETMNFSVSNELNKLKLHIIKAHDFLRMVLVQDLG